MAAQPLTSYLISDCFVHLGGNGAAGGGDADACVVTPPVTTRIGVSSNLVLRRHDDLMRCQDENCRKVTLSYC